MGVMSPWGRVSMHMHVGRDVTWGQAMAGFKGRMLAGKVYGAEVKDDQLQ